jgi:hypothetical protein
VCSWPPRSRRQIRTHRTPLALGPAPLSGAELIENVLQEKAG